MAFKVSGRSFRLLFQGLQENRWIFEITGFLILGQGYFGILEPGGMQKDCCPSHDPYFRVAFPGMERDWEEAESFMINFSGMGASIKIAAA